MEKYYQVINLCESVDRNDLSEFLQDIIESIKPILEEVEDSDYSSEEDSKSSEDEEIDEGGCRAAPHPSHKKIEEEDYKVHIDENGFWSFVFSDDEED